MEILAQIKPIMELGNFVALIFVIIQLEVIKIRLTHSDKDITACKERLGIA